MAASKSGSSQDAIYLDVLLDPLSKCAKYKPKFGTIDKKGVSLEQFKQMYGDDPFYHWVGIDSDLMYAAHKAAGGMTSVYRQLGAGCECLFQALLQDCLGLSTEEARWEYEVTKEDGSKAKLKLDGRIDVSHPRKQSDRKRVKAWINRCSDYLGMPEARVKQLNGAVFEVRQGYKSADAKRQNADLRYGMNCAMANYLPIISIISTQASQTVIRRYQNAKILVLTGVLSSNDTQSTYAFFKKVVGFDLAGFFQRNSVAMRKRCEKVLQDLLNPKPGK